MSLAVAAEARPPIREGQERPYAMRLDRRGTVGCRGCGDTLWIEVFDQRAGPHAFTPTVKPCRCHPGYETWATGWRGPDGAKRSQPEFVPTVSHTPSDPVQESF